MFLTATLIMVLRSIWFLCRAWGLDQKYSPLF